MSKFYAVTISYTAIIRADNESEAEVYAATEARDIVSDAPRPEPVVEQEITSLDQLTQFGWDGMCLPYGDTDRNTRLNEYLPK